MKIAWWQWLPFWRWRVVATVASADEAPERLPKTGAVLVCDQERAKWVLFDCPCHTGHRIMLNLDSARKPRWALDRQQPLTISPSIDFKSTSRRCHYFIRAGRVLWARGSTR